jgi:hypothetical protein
MADDVMNAKRVTEFGAGDALSGVWTWPVQDAQDDVRPGGRGFRLLVRLVCQSVQHEPEREDRHRGRNHNNQENGLCGMSPRIAGGKPTDQTEATHPVTR